jgi:regulatory protein
MAGRRGARSGRGWDALPPRLPRHPPDEHPPGEAADGEAERGNVLARRRRPSPGGHPTTPSEPGGYPTTPSEPGGYPTTPSEPGGYPTTPSEPGGYPAASSTPGGHSDASSVPGSYPAGADGSGGHSATSSGSGGYPAGGGELGGSAGYRARLSGSGGFLGASGGSGGYSIAPGGSGRGGFRRGGSGAEGGAGSGAAVRRGDLPEQSESERAREICLRQLAVRPRTRAELAKALARKEISGEVIAEVLDRYDEVGIIDDAAFARAWVSSRHHGRGLARRALANELRQHGVDSEVASEALETLDDEEEAATARALVDRKLRTARGTPEAVFRRLVGMLARKGYPAGLAIRAVKDALAARDAEAAEFADQIDADALADEAGEPS